MSDFGLTSRELEVMELLICGYNNFEISERLGISKHTAKLHVLSIYKKLNVDNRLSATLKYKAICDDSRAEID